MRRRTETVTEPGTTIDIKGTIQAVVDGRELTTDEATATMDAIMTGQVTGAQIGALVTALRMRGETVEEIAGFAIFSLTDHHVSHLPGHAAESKPVVGGFRRA